MVAQPLLSSSPSVEAAAAVTFDVVSAFTSLDPSGPQAGAPITEWKYRIDRDHTGDPYDDPADCEFDRELEQFPANFPDDCSWPSVNSFEPGNYTTGDVGESIATIVTHGDWTDFEPGGDYAGGITLDNGKYLVSVTAAGHKIGGAHFTVTDATVSPELITVALDPYPLPLVTLRARVFNDLSTNGQID